MPNVCPCPNPPGGAAVCPDDHLAICRVVNGQAHTECVPPPTDLSDIQVANWVLRVVTGRRRELDQPLSKNDSRVLESGEYLDRKLGVRVSFAMPREHGGRLPPVGTPIPT
jgi:hypothetical protein